MAAHKTRRTCPNGHQYWKSSDCPVCPICEKGRALGDDWLDKLSAPAKRALATLNICSTSGFSKYKESEIASLHGIGPNALSKIKEAMAVQGISFSK